jgi:hypothetical protein
MTSIATLFATPTLAALLSVFARDPGRTYIQKELVDETDGSLYLVQRELMRLEQTGLIARKARGRHVEYTANTRHPAFSGLREVLLATVGIGDRLRDTLTGLPDVRLAFVFGSVAAGGESPESDLDVFVVGKLGLREVAARLVPACAIVSPVMNTSSPRCSQGPRYGWLVMMMSLQRLSAEALTARRFH